MTQRLISALLEENIVTSVQDTMESEGQGKANSSALLITQWQFSLILDELSTDENAKSSGMKTTLNGPQAAALERRIRQELEEQGILTADEANVSQVIKFTNLLFNRERKIHKFRLRPMTKY